MNWVEKYIQLHNFYLNNLHKLSSGKTPSMLFYHTPRFEYDNMSSKEYSQISANANSCANTQETQDTFFDIIKSGSAQMAKNLYNSHGICYKLKELFDLT